jgi:hypothetical protein
LTTYPVLFAYGLAGLAGSIIMSLRQRRWPGTLVIAIGIFLIMDLFVTTRPWKQYAISWLLLAACLPARLLPPLIARLGPPAQATLALFVLVATGVGFARKEMTDPHGGGMNRATQDRVIEWIYRQVPPDGYIVTSFNLHPVFRRDVFFKTVYDTAPQATGTGDGLEEFMPRLVPFPYAEHFQRAGYEKDLETHPPAVIVVGTEYSLGQVEALQAYMARHAGAYRLCNIPATSITALVRETDRPVE